MIFLDTKRKGVRMILLGSRGVWRQAGGMGRPARITDPEAVEHKGVGAIFPDTRKEPQKSS